MNDLPVVVSGIQPSGRLHLGNYFGAIHQHISIANDHTRRSEAYYFIVNYHALTTLRDPDLLESYTLDVALDYLALGFDPDKGAHLFVQSDVPQVTELAWIFSCITPVSQMEKGLAYKDKVSRGLSANMGLFSYPILQAADILAYSGQLVPVGADQKQNLEISRDLATRFNQTFCEPFGREPLFPTPEALIVDEVATVPGIDGRKMSKSYGNDIGIFEEGKDLRKKIMSIVTDSKPLEDPKDPELDNVFSLIKLFANYRTRRQIASKYRAGGYGYGHAKKELLEMIESKFSDARALRRELESKPEEVKEVLRKGGEAAYDRAERLMRKVRSYIGLDTSNPIDRSELPKLVKSLRYKNRGLEDRLDLEKKRASGYKDRIIALQVQNRRLGEANTSSITQKHMNPIRESNTTIRINFKKSKHSQNANNNVMFYRDLLAGGSDRK